MAEIAAKQRHLLLLEKVRNNQPLTAPQLRELKDYEESMRAKKTTEKPVKKRPPEAGIEVLCAMAGIEAAEDTEKKEKTGFKGNGLCALAGRLGMAEGDLAALVKKNPKRAALLCRLAALAAAPAISAEQAADRLGFAPEAFEKLLKKDPQAGRIWRHVRIDEIVAAGNRLKQLAADGNTAAARKILEALQENLAGTGDPSAMPTKEFAALIGETYARVIYWQDRLGMPTNGDRTVNLKAALDWWRRHLIREHSFDPGRVKQIDLEPYLGVSRQTVHEWLKEGMPRNADKTYNLPEVLAWRMERIGAQAAAGGGGTSEREELARLNARKKALQIKQMERQLVSSDQAMAWKLWTAWKVCGWLDANIEKMCMDLAGLTPDRVKTVLDQHFAAMRKQACERPENYRQMLPEGIAEKFAAILKELEGSDHEGHEDHEEK